MKLVKSTEYLNVFESEVFHLFDGETVHRRLYVGFVRDAEDDSKRWPAVTALFTILPDDDDTTKYMLEWLETSRYTGETEPLDGQVIRDEFMGALRGLHPGLYADCEAQEAADGSRYFLDTLDGAKLL